jgi:cyanate permease
MAVGGVVSPYVAGALRDRTGDWVLPFLTAGGCDVAAGMIVLTLARVERLPGADPD